MVDNFECGNFEILTLTLRHQTGLCVGNLVPHFQHIVTIGQLKGRQGVGVGGGGWGVMMLGDAMTPF